MKKNLLFLGVLIVVFVAGWFGRKAFESPQQPVTSEKAEIIDKPIQLSLTSRAPSSSLEKEKELEVKLQPREVKAVAVVSAIEEAMKLNDEERAAKLPVALEKITEVVLTPDLMDILRKILKQKNLDECSYLLSVMEQREDRESRKLMIEALDNSDADVKERAMFALETVAGTSFKSADEARSWEKTWVPDPENVKLFHGDLNDQGVPASDIKIRESKK
jgi:hypothetical protein